MPHDSPLPARRTPEEPGVQASQELETLPTSAPGSVFRRFCYRYGVVGNLCLGVGFLVPPVAVALGALSAGLGGAAAGMGAGVGAFWALMNRVTVYGNGRLRAELARRLGLADPDAAEFVGLCLPENNTVQAKLLTMRLETDDNVGFLLLEDERMSVLLEEGRLEISRASIRQAAMERFVELPYLRWIVVEYYEDGTLRRLLLCSRQCRSLREAREATDRLMARIADWYTEPVIQQLEHERWLEKRPDVGTPSRGGDAETREDGEPHSPKQLGECA